MPSVASYAAKGSSVYSSPSFYLPACSVMGIRSSKSAFGALCGYYPRSHRPSACWLETFWIVLVAILWISPKCLGADGGHGGPTTFEDCEVYQKDQKFFVETNGTKVRVAVFPPCHSRDTRKTPATTRLSTDSVEPEDVEDSSIEENDTNKNAIQTQCAIFNSSQLQLQWQEENTTLPKGQKVVLRTLQEEGKTDAYVVFNCPDEKLIFDEAFCGTSVKSDAHELYVNGNATASLEVQLCQNEAAPGNGNPCLYNTTINAMQIGDGWKQLLFGRMDVEGLTLPRVLVIQVGKFLKGFMFNNSEDRVHLGVSSKKDILWAVGWNPAKRDSGTISPPEATDSSLLPEVETTDSSLLPEVETTNSSLLPEAETTDSSLTGYWKPSSVIFMLGFFALLAITVYLVIDKRWRTENCQIKQENWTVTKEQEPQVSERVLSFNKMSKHSRTSRFSHTRETTHSVHPPTYSDDKQEDTAYVDLVAIPPPPAMPPPPTPEFSLGVNSDQNPNTKSDRISVASSGESDYADPNLLRTNHIKLCSSSDDDDDHDYDYIDMVMLKRQLQEDDRETDENKYKADMKNLFSYDSENSLYEQIKKIESEGDQK